VAAHSAQDSQANVPGCSPAGHPPPCSSKVVAPTWAVLGFAGRQSQSTQKPPSSNLGTAW